MRTNLTAKQIAALKTLPHFEMDRSTFDQMLLAIREEERRTARKPRRFIVSQRVRLVTASVVAVGLFAGMLWHVRNQVIAINGPATAANPSATPREIPIPKGFISFQPVKLGDSSFKYQDSSLMVEKSKSGHVFENYTVQYGKTESGVQLLQISEEPTLLKNGPFEGASAIQDLPKYRGRILVKKGLIASTSSNEYGNVIGYVSRHIRYELSSQTLNYSQLVTVANSLTVPVVRVGTVNTQMIFLRKLKNQIHFRYVVPETPAGYHSSVVQIIDESMMNTTFNAISFQFQAQHGRKVFQVWEAPENYGRTFWHRVTQASVMKRVEIGGHVVTTQMNNKYFWSDPRQSLYYYVQGAGTSSMTAIYRNVIDSLFRASSKVRTKGN